MLPGPRYFPPEIPVTVINLSTIFNCSSPPLPLTIRFAIVPTFEHTQNSTSSPNTDLSFQGLWLAHCKSLPTPSVSLLLPLPPAVYSHRAATQVC